MSKAELGQDERRIETWSANRSQGWRAVGGHLLLTDQRLVFYPHLFDRMTAGRRWECLLTSLTAVEMAPRGSNPFALDVSLRRRLRIESRGKSEFFVVGNGDEVVALIQRATGT